MADWLAPWTLLDRSALGPLFLFEVCSFLNLERPLWRHRTHFGPTLGPGSRPGWSGFWLAGWPAGRPREAAGWVAEWLVEWLAGWLLGPSWTVRLWDSFCFLQGALSFPRKPRRQLIGPCHVYIYIYIYVYKQTSFYKPHAQS